MKFFDYVNQVGGRVEIGAIKGPNNNFNSILDVFKTAYAHEQIVTKNIQSYGFSYGKKEIMLL